MTDFPLSVEYLSTPTHPTSITQLTDFSSLNFPFYYVWLRITHSHLTSFTHVENIFGGSLRLAL